jgi:hypothetical protein
LKQKFEAEISFFLFFCCYEDKSGRTSQSYDFSQGKLKFTVGTVDASATAFVPRLCRTGLFVFSLPRLTTTKRRACERRHTRQP